MKDANKRKTFTRFRISNHNLLIELGRYQNLAQEERLCKVCSSGEIETECHFLTSCKAYDHIRETFLNSLKNSLVPETSQNTQHISVDIMKSTDSATIIKLSKLICYVLMKDPNALKPGVLIGRVFTYAFYITHNYNRFCNLL